MQNIENAYYANFHPESLWNLLHEDSDVKNAASQTIMEFVNALTLQIYIVSLAMTKEGYKPVKMLDFIYENE